jgi:glycosyltransferase involved in cell wall biosynthesis
MVYCMRISHFCSSFEPTTGGVVSGLLAIVKELPKFGIQNQIISFGNTNRQLEKNKQVVANLNSIGVAFLLTIAKFKNNYGIGSLKGISGLLNRVSKPDLVVLHQIYTFSTFFGYIYAKRVGIPYGVMPHGSLTNYHESDSRHIKFLAKKIIISRILLESDAIIVTCESEKADLSTTLQSKAVIIPYGTFFQNQGGESRTFLQLTDRNLRIVYSGRFDKKKNLLLLIESLPKVLEKYPELILDIAGSGSKNEVDKVRRLVSSLQLERSVRFYGWVESAKMRQLLSASKLLVLPSENENFAIVVAEALSLGIPCVVSKFVGTADLVAKYRAGEVISELTPNSIANGIIKLLQGDEVEYRRAAIEATRVELDWSKIALKWKALVASLA